MWKKIAFTLLFAVASSSITDAHQFYISITSIQHHAESEKLSVNIKVFINDLEESIYQESGTRIGLWKNKPVENANDYIKKYISSRLSISINEIPASLQFVRLTIEPAEILEDNVLLYQMEVNNVKDIRTMKVRNSLLTETIDSQINIIKIKANDTRKLINLDKKLPEEEIVFD